MIELADASHGMLVEQPARLAALVSACLADPPSGPAGA
jgi:hypothetical protein